MNRNVESHFSELPSVEIQRSIFDRSSSHKTSFNVGELIPIFVDEVLPGDTFDMTTSCVVRLQTLLTPIMDNIYLDTYFFFVPNRIVWTHWKNFMGENGDSAWLPAQSYRIPRTSYAAGGFNVHTIADYFGIPTGVASNQREDYPISLPFRGYAMICNEWFRDQNLQDPVNFSTGDADVAGSNSDNQVTDIVKGGAPFKVNKFHDYFTSCLPSPQKSGSISIFGNQIGGSFDKLVPVYPTANVSYPHVDGSTRVPLQFGVSTSTSAYKIISAKAVTAQDNSTISVPYVYSGDLGSPGYTVQNLWANVGAMDLSINELRLAFQLQKFFEKNARAGTRYREILKEHFSVTSPDSRMMIPEYLGGHRIPLVIHQVANQSQGENDFLGDLGAMSNTSDVHDDFIKSFTEHGFVIGVACVRYDHSYPQGLEPFWQRINATDYYWPVFANIGEVPVKKRSICLVDYDSSNPGNGDANMLTFGYQEAWADYRYKPNRCSSLMRPQASGTLASWHLADDYNSMPSLSASWIREDKANVDRCLAVTSAASDQVFADFYFNLRCTRPMPMYSIPGLIDHH